MNRNKSSSPYKGSPKPVIARRKFLDLELCSSPTHFSTIHTNSKAYYVKICCSSGPLQTPACGPYLQFKESSLISFSAAYHSALVPHVFQKQQVTERLWAVASAWTSCDSHLRHWTTNATAQITLVTCSV